MEASIQKSVQPSVAAAIQSATPTTPPSYAGPLDIVSGPLLAFSAARALSNAYRGSPLYTIRNGTSNATQAFSADATTGVVPVSAISTFLGAADGLVTQWNDQSGGGHNAAQATAANQPPWVPDTTGAFPGIGSVTEGINQRQLDTAPITWAGGALTVIVVMKTPDTTDWAHYFNALNFASLEFGAGLGQGWNAPGDIYFHHAGATTSARWMTSEEITPGLHIIEVACDDSGGCVIVVDGVSLTVTVEDPPADPITTISGQPVTVSPAGYGYLAAQEMVESLIYTSALNSTQRAAIRQNMADFYGITLA